MTITTAGQSVAKSGQGIVNDPTRLVIASYAVKDSKEWLADFKNREASNIIMEPPRHNEHIRLACFREENDADNNNQQQQGVVIASYDKTIEGANKFSQEGLLHNKLVAPPIEPNIICDLLFDKWDVDPSTIKTMDDELMVYIGGHGVLNFDQWFDTFVKYPHNKEFPGCIRTLAAKGPRHKDGSDTCIFVHVFNKKYESEVKSLFFGEEKKLTAQEGSVVLPYYPDLLASIQSGHEGW